MPTSKIERTLTKVRSPRAAAINGIVFSILTITVMLFFQDSVTGTSGNINKEWLDKHLNKASFFLNLVPFIGISFLWFTAVLRDWLDDQEDRFCSTVFIASSILIVAMFFVWGATFGALIKTSLVNIKGMSNSAAVYIFGHSFMKEILTDYTFRVIGVYMLSIATLWRKTDLMPRFIIISTYLLAILFIFFAVKIAETRFVFPCWVFLVSVYILNNKYRWAKKNRNN